MDLSNLQPAEGSKHSDNFRRGRGHGSGNGKTAGKGHKGQLARSGAPRNRDLKVVRCLYTDVCLREDSKTEIQKRLLQSTLTYLNRFEDGAEVTVESSTCKRCNLKNARDGVKILGNGELTKKLTC